MEKKPNLRMRQYKKNNIERRGGIISTATFEFNEPRPCCCFPSQIKQKNRQHDLSSVGKVEYIDFFSRFNLALAPYLSRERKRVRRVIQIKGTRMGGFEGWGSVRRMRRSKEGKGESLGEERKYIDSGTDYCANGLAGRC